MNAVHVCFDCRREVKDGVCSEGCKRKHSGMVERNSIRRDSDGYVTDCQLVSRHRDA